MPAKCGSSPRANVGIVLSVRHSAPGSPMSSAHFCSLRQPASDNCPSASSAFQPWVARRSKSGWWRRARTGAAIAPALRERRTFWLVNMAGSLGLRIVGGRVERLGEAEHRDGAVAPQIEIVGDNGAEAPGRLRIDPVAVEGQETGAQPE